jgi:tRNA-dihydrouridine synthase B
VETGVDGVTVARGAIGNPFIFRECLALLSGHRIPPPSISEQRAAIELHLAETLKECDIKRAGPDFRKFGIAYSDLHPMRDEVRQAFIHAPTTDAIYAVIASWYDDRRTWPEVKPRETVRDLIAAGAER